MGRFVLLFSLVSAIWAQRPGTLQFDTSNMKVTVAMDRAEYLPGEIAQITLTVSNPASKPVVSLAPFSSSTTCLYSTLKNGDPKREREAISTACASVPINTSNTTTFGPGESKRLVLNSFDRLFELSRPSLFGGFAPATPGDYLLAFQFGGSAAVPAEYKVRTAKLESRSHSPCT